MNKHLISSPDNKRHWQDYYLLRWKVLRKPWGQPKGSEKDALEKKSIHRMALCAEKIIGVGRIHQVSSTVAQVRYMAVDMDFLGQGVGSAILASLEEAGKAMNIDNIQLNSRETALNFYQKKGYRIEKKAHMLYGEIPHYLMSKPLEDA